MASAVLASRNDSTWPPMGKITYTNPHMKPNPNPNPNPKKKRKHFHEATPNNQPPPLHKNFDSPVVTQTASDDAYSINQPSTSRNVVNYGGFVTFEVSTYTKSEIIKLRKRFLAELDRVRDFRTRIESGSLEIPGRTESKVKKKRIAENPSYVAVVPKKLSNGLDNGFNDALNIEELMKECRKIVAKLLKLKRADIFRAPVDVVGLGLHDYHMIVKRPMDIGTVKANLSKGNYSTPTEFADDVRLTFNNAMLYNAAPHLVHSAAEHLLARFEQLFKPIQDKMDAYVGTRREDFYGNNDELHFRGIDELQGSSWNNNSVQVGISPLKAKKAKPKASPADQVFRKQDQLPVAIQAHSSASTPSNPPAPANHPLLLEELPTPVKSEPPAVKVGRGATVKQPKPRAKDLIKREMSMEEKQKLGLGLQSLPQEKMPQLIQIIRKRNEHLAQDGDEIELDIEALDTETLWELDRFVTNWKKMVSKTKRQALMTNNDLDIGSSQPPSSFVAEHDAGGMVDNVKDSGTKVKENEDEDVDIDDDTPAASFPPVDIDKDDGGAGGGGVTQDQNQGRSDHGDASSTSSSGSSSSGSSSSSDSDSGSSSGSDSDGDDAHS